MAAGLIYAIPILVFYVRSHIKDMLCKKIAPLSNPTSTLVITSTLCAQHLEPSAHSVYMSVIFGHWLTDYIDRVTQSAGGVAY